MFRRERGRNSFRLQCDPLQRDGPAALQNSPLNRGTGADIGSFAQHDSAWGRTGAAASQDSLGHLLLDALNIVVSE